MARLSATTGELSMCERTEYSAMTCGQSDDHGGRGLGRLKLLAAHHFAAGELCSPPLDDALHRLVAVRLVPVSEPLALGNQQHVLHEPSSSPLWVMGPF